MIINRKDLPRVRSSRRGDIVYCSGTFDLLHARHMLFLDRCKAAGNFLVVGVGSDHDIKMHKGATRPIQDEQVRSFAIDHLSCVDYCFINGNTKEGQNPLEIEREVLKLLRPEIYRVNDDAFDIPYRQKIADECEVKLVVGEREKDIPDFLRDISTTSLIEQIKTHNLLPPSNDDPYYVSEEVYKEWVAHKPTAHAGCVVLGKDNDVLILKRSFGSSKGLWEFPSGQIEKNESIEDGARREMREETGIDFRKELCDMGYFRYVDDRITNIIIMFYARLKENSEVKLNREHDEFKWVSLESVTLYPMNHANQAIVATLRRLVRELANI